MTYQQIIDALDKQMELDEIAANIDLAEMRGEITHEQADEARDMLLEEE